MKVIEIIKDGKKIIRKRVYTRPQGVSKTDQSQKESCDVNNIMKQYMKNKDASILKQKVGVYADVADIPDLGQAMMQVKQADEAFMTLPANLRKKFDNDPQQFIAYLQNPANDEEAIKLGLKVKKESGSVPTEPTAGKPDGAPANGENPE